MRRGAAWRGGRGSPRQKDGRRGRLRWTVDSSVPGGEVLLYIPLHITKKASALGLRPNPAEPPTLATLSSTVAASPRYMCTRDEETQSIWTICWSGLDSGQEQTQAGSRGPGRALPGVPGTQPGRNRGVFRLVGGQTKHRRGIPSIPLISVPATSRRTGLS